MFHITNQKLGDMQAAIQTEKERQDDILNKSVTDFLTREKTLEIFFQQQKMEREAWQRVSRL